MDFPPLLGVAGLVGRDRRRAQIFCSWERTNIFQSLLSEAEVILFPVSSGTGEHGRIGKGRKFSHIDIRVIHTLSSIMLQSSHTANIALKYFKSKHSIQNLVTIFSCNDAGVSGSGDVGFADRIHYLAGFGISFLFGLGNATAFEAIEARDERAMVDRAIIACLSDTAHSLGSQDNQVQSIDLPCSQPPYPNA